MTIADTPALPASVARGDWPEPHHLRVVAPETPVLERATVTMNDGSRVQGTFVRLNPGARMLEFRPDKGPAAQNIPFGDFRSLYLTRAVEVEPIPGPEAHGEALTPSRSQRKCTVRFHGGTELSGDTVGIVARRFGLYLYMVNYGTNVLRWFVPSEAMEGYQLDQPLGQLLVEQKAASAEAVDAALARQRELRDRRIGEYLRNESMVSQDQLEEALLRQKTLRHLRLGDALVQQKVITEAERDTALERQRTDRRKPLGEILVEMNLVPPDTVRRVLVDQLGFPSVNLRRFQYEPNALKSIPAEMAHQHCVIPLYRTESRVAMAMENPLGWETLQALEFYTGLKVDPVIADRDDLLKTIDQFYGIASEAKGGIRALVAELDASPRPEQEGLRYLDAASEPDHVLVRLVNKIITDALEQGASDIHIESRPDERPSRVRLRIDGVLSAYAEIPSSFRAAIVSRLKIMAQMDIAERRRPQDGKINFAEFGPAAIELRVVTIPVAQGMEDVVLRLLPAPRAMSLAQLGLLPRVLEGLKSAASRPYGLVFVCGPTGSGKTTTLHSLLGHINSPERKIWTVEDPVEITQEGLCQVQVNARIGLGFVDVLRSFMRADPDVIMVGETRDGETARTVISASLTGHLVLSTMHTNSAAESIVRLLDFGLDPFNFSDALLAIVSQRLVRRLCPSCRKPRVASREELNALANEYCRDTPLDDREVVAGWQGRYANAEGGITLHGPHGCEHCDQSGYKGRLGVHELLVASPRIKVLIQARASTTDIAAASMAEGMLSLRQDGIEKVLQGHTDMHQVEAVCI